MKYLMHLGCMSAFVKVNTFCLKNLKNDKQMKLFEFFMCMSQAFLINMTFNTTQCFSLFVDC